MSIFGRQMPDGPEANWIDPSAPRPAVVPEELPFGENGQALAFDSTICWLGLSRSGNPFCCSAELEIPVIEEIGGRLIPA